MTTTHIPGFPRIGERRELKFALERFWRGESDEQALQQEAARLREQHWQWQAGAGLDWVSVGDFSLYDGVLDHACLFGVVPERFGHDGGPVSLTDYFRMARGRSPGGEDAVACEMTKWFDTNYHYLVPEFSADQTFELHPEALLIQLREAQDAGHTAKPVILGPLTFLWLGKAYDENVDKLDLLEGLIPRYGQLLDQLRDAGAAWVQIDEPILSLDLPDAWRQSFERTYNRLQIPGLNLLLASYFGGLHDNLALACSLPTAGLHLDLTRDADNLRRVLDALPPYKVLSCGVIDGRNIWRADLRHWEETLAPLRQRLGDRLWLSSGCSLLHVPVDLELETKLDAEKSEWLAFARQKLAELNLLARVLDGEAGAKAELQAHQRHVEARRESGWVHRADVKARLAALDATSQQRSQPFAERYARQQAHLNLPLYPTTTIGSFPQTGDIRRTRRAYKQGEIDAAEYEARMQAAIAECIREQEAIGLDVLVHGEPERNDMVEYFGEHLEGVLTTQYGWVQSYGSRCVKPPILAGDIRRPEPITVPWIGYAQSLTDKPVKGMLTGPVTILQWSFVRDDQPRAETCRQLALFVRDEVADLEAAGTSIIQIDEPALREGLPLRVADKQAYLDWAVGCFRLASAGAAPTTQIHTHMCYAEFHDILADIARMDADVITLETARSALELLTAFKDFAYPNAVGPGVYDIHSPVTPSGQAMQRVIDTASALLPAERLWVNPDCGLKTRRWSEVRPALEAMVETAGRLRNRTVGT